MSFTAFVFEIALRHSDREDFRNAANAGAQWATYKIANPPQSGNSLAVGRGQKSTLPVVRPAPDDVRLFRERDLEVGGIAPDPRVGRRPARLWSRDQSFSLFQNILG